MRKFREDTLARFDESRRNRKIEKYASVENKERKRARKRKSVKGVRK